MAAPFVTVERIAAQQLSGSAATSAAAVAHRLLAVQAQDPRGARLAVRSRSAGLCAADVDDALNARSMVITWLNRGTLHLVTTEDYWWLHPLTTPQLATESRRRLGNQGVTEAEAEQGIEVVADAVATHGPQTRAELRRCLDEAGVPTADQALTQVLFAASLRGAVVRGPMRGREHAYVSVADWLGDAPEPLERSDALTRLAYRYLAGHGPADARDLAKWAGVTLGDARAGFDGIRSELTERTDGLLDLADRPAPAPLPAPLLLGAFDPLLLGWASRDAIVGPHSVVTSNGMFSPCALVDGRVVATWGLSGATVTVKPLEKVKPSTIDALRADAADVLQFLGLPATSEIVFEPVR